MDTKQQPEALRSIQRFEVVDCIDDKHVPAVIPKPHGPWVRYEDHIAALAAGQATAAQEVVPADQDDSLHLCASDLQHSAIYDNHVEMQSCMRAVADRSTALAPAQPTAQQGAAYADAHGAIMGAAYDFRDAHISGSPNQKRSAHAALESAVTHALRASHGQAPAPTHEQIAAYLESTGAYVTNDATREAAIAEAIDTDRAKRGQAPDLHPKTSDLVQRFAAALAEKLSAAEKKYGYSDGWASPNWMDECRQHLSAHIAKGDPRDVAAYCAFLWHHGATTASPQAEQQAPTGSEIYVCARKCYNCGHAGINDDHADNAACKSCDWSGPSPEKDHCPDCEKDGTMTAACPMCSCAYIMVADTQVAAPAAPAQPAAEASRFGSPELQAMIIARCVEKDQADSVQEDAARYRWLRRWKGQEHEPPFTVQHEIDGTLWGGDLDAAIDAAMNKGGA